jgi:putative flippase GtrA
MLPEVIARHWTLIRYLIAGGYNTLFGFAVFTGLFFLLESSLHYIVIASIAQIINITNSYVVYRVFVFRSRGRIITEYLRIYLVYGVSFILGIALLALLVEVAGLHPVLAQLFVIIITVIVSYLGNSRFTFGRGMDE